MRVRPPLVTGFSDKIHHFDDPLTAMEFLEGRERVTNALYIPPKQLILQPNNFTVGGLRVYKLTILQIINWTLRIRASAHPNLTYAELVQLYNFGLAKFPYRLNDTKCIVDTEEQSIRGVLSPRRKYYSLCQMFSVFLNDPLIRDNYEISNLTLYGSVLKALLQRKDQQDLHVFCYLNEASQHIESKVYRRRKQIMSKKVKISAAVLKHLPAAIRTCLS